MILSHKIALDTTSKQRAYFARCAGTARFVWNNALAQWSADYAAGGRPSGAALKRCFNQDKYEQFPWMKDVHRDCHSQPFANLQKAFAAWFSGTAKRPRFKKKGQCRDSFYVANDKFRVSGGTVTLPKIGSVRMRESLRFTGKITGAVVSRTADRWYISIQVDVGEYHRERTGDGIAGVDLGLTTSATVSNGHQYQGPKSLQRGLKKLRRASRQHSRKQKGSKNRAKVAKRLAKLHARIARVRNDWLHKTTTTLMRENQAIFIEDLAVRNMMKNRHLSRAIADSGWREFRRQCEYKSAIYGNVFGVVNRWFASSKTCRVCGQIKQSLALSDRVYRCDGCGHEEDRDLNAAHNICTAGLAGIDAHGPEGPGSRRKAKAKPRRAEVRTEPCPLMDTI